MAEPRALHVLGLTARGFHRIRYWEWGDPANPRVLTAGIFSEDRKEIAEFFDRIEAGVVYANRKGGATTGAWPGCQSFAGWKASGSTGKGGLGPYYVQQFMREQSQTVVVGDGDGEPDDAAGE